MSEHCNFGPSLNEMLRDRIVCGIEDAKIQQRLLAEPDLTFDKAFELVLASESADKNVKDLQLLQKLHWSLFIGYKESSHCLPSLWRKAQVSRLSSQSCRVPPTVAKLDTWLACVRARVNPQRGKCHTHQNINHNARLLLVLPIRYLSTLTIIQCTT